MGEGGEKNTSLTLTISAGWNSRLLVCDFIMIGETLAQFSS